MTNVHPQTTIGHVHLKVADLDRAIGFYSGVLGFAVRQRFGSQAAFLSAGGYHHHIGLNTWDSAGGTPAPRGHTGLYHTAFLYPNRAELADALHRVVSAGIPIDGPQITACPRRFISPTPTAMVSSSTETALNPTGPVTQRVI